MFPGGWPGAGLLLLRVAAALPLLIRRQPRISRCAPFVGLCDSIHRNQRRGLAARRFVDPGCVSFENRHRTFGYLLFGGRGSRAPFAGDAWSKSGHAWTRRMVRGRPAVWPEAD